MSNSRDFSFFIRWSVQSSEFEITNTSVTVSGFAEVVDQWGLPVSGYDNHQYEIILRETSFHWRSRTVELTTGQFRETIELPSTGNYKIEIVNKDYLPSNYSLSGNGSVSW
ncbi:hypothetical protein [Natranaerovirga hydrolytica]|nr:hypothetical protein [Natranaerovirga hydrolytica]